MPVNEITLTMTEKPTPSKVISLAYGSYGEKNTMIFKLLNQDKTPVDLSNTTQKIRLYDVRKKINIFTKNCIAIDASKGITKYTPTSDDFAFTRKNYMRISVESEHSKEFSEEALLWIV